MGKSCLKVPALGLGRIGLNFVAELDDIVDIEISQARPRNFAVKIGPD